MSLWRDHLKETGRSCGKNSNYWKSWFAKLDLSLDSDIDGEVLVADIESNCDECDCDDIVSDTDSPLITDDDRRSGPADQDQQLQGGPDKSKHFEVMVDEITKSVFDADEPPVGHISAFRAELLTEAKSRFAQFKGIEVSEVSEEQLSRTSLGVEGWACSKVLTESDLAGSRRGDSPCCAFGGRSECRDDPGSDPLGCSSDPEMDDELHNS